MAKLKTYQLSGEAAGECTLGKVLQKSEANPQMIKDYLVAIRANARQWSANTKGRSQVCHSNKKPHRQKGTGNARQGTLAAPQYKGGGVVFGPKPKFNQHVSINRKERQAAIRHLMTEKISEGKLFVIKDFSGLEQPKTKTIVSMLDAIKISRRSILFVGESLEQEGQTISSDHHDPLKKSVRNLPGAAFVMANQINGYDLACAHSVVITQAALKEVEKWLGAE